MNAWQAVAVTLLGATVSVIFTFRLLKWLFGDITG